MVLKMAAVQRRLIKKSEAVVAKDVQLRDLERINAELKKQLIRHLGPDVGQRLNRSRYAVKAKSRQIKASCRLTFDLWKMCRKAKMHVNVFQRKSSERAILKLKIIERQRTKENGARLFIFTVTRGGSRAGRLNAESKLGRTIICVLKVWNGYSCSGVLTMLSPVDSFVCDTCYYPFT